MSETEPSLAWVAVDVDVLAADLSVDGPTRVVLDHLRRHSWTMFVASDPLLSDAGVVVSSLTDADLTVDWRKKTDSWTELVAHSDGDSPALTSAYRGGVIHLFTFDDRLSSAQTDAALGGRFPVSVRRPEAFASLFTPESLYAEVEGGPYPGPDRDLWA